ncbi:MAG TPA: hypothetical protein PLO89_04510 [Spirochaetota bacterium]|nr:hypothetical protein [Spirochaetota bacterium]
MENTVARQSELLIEKIKYKAVLKTLFFDLLLGIGSGLSLLKTSKIRFLEVPFNK